MLFPHFSITRSSQFERIKGQFDCLALVIVSIKAGVEHLREKLGSLPDEFDVEHVIITENTLPDVIRSSGDMLVEVHTRTKENELKMHLIIQDSKFTKLRRSASHGRNFQTRRPLTSGVTEDRPFNQRISLPSAKEMSAFDPESDAETGFGDVDVEEEISRDGVKKASSNIIATEERKKLRSRKIENQ